MDARKVGRNDWSVNMKTLSKIRMFTVRKWLGKNIVNPERNPMMNAITTI